MPYLSLPTKGIFLCLLPDWFVVCWKFPILMWQIDIQFYKSLRSICHCIPHTTCVYTWKSVTVKSYSIIMVKAWSSVICGLLWLLQLWEGTIWKWKIKGISSHVHNQTNQTPWPVSQQHHPCSHPATHPLWTFCQKKSPLYGLKC